MKENTKTWAGWYISYTRTPWWHAGPPVQRSWIGEVEEPWRYGKGLLVRVWPTLALTLGRWAPTDTDKLSDIRADAASVEEIMEWSGSRCEVALPSGRLVHL